MIFTLEALDAKHGDSLLLHFGAPERPRLALIDGGPNGVWTDPLSGRLEALRAALGDEDGTLRIELAMVSHIDDDHINGLLDMTRALLKKKDEGVHPLPWNVLQLWHNHFEDLLGDGGASARLAQAAGKPATASAGEVAVALGLSECAAVVASVNQGRKLAQDAAALSIPLNPGFGGGLVRARGDEPKVVATANVKWLVLGPSDARLDALRTEWQTVVAKSQTAGYGAEVAAFLDKSVFNLSSLIVLARSGARTILLTGDARGDDILDALRLGGLLDGGGAHFDVLKVPHHGSDRNVTREFFETVTADHYVISADGKHDNPDVKMLRMLAEARGTDAYTIHLTNRVPRAVNELRKLKKGRSFRVVVRPKSRRSLLIELGDPLPDEVRP